MPRPRSLSSYTDIKVQLLSIREAGGAEMKFPSFGGAVSWVARVYTYRKLLRDAAREGMPETFDPSTPWDDLLVSHDKKNRSTSVFVRFGTVTKGEMLPLPANLAQSKLLQISDVPVVDVDDDELLRVAMEEVEKNRD